MGEKYLDRIEIQLCVRKSLEATKNAWNLKNIIINWFGLVGFYGISIIAGYLMPNPVYTAISKICMTCRHIL